MPDLYRALGLLAWNSVLFLCIGRWSVQRSVRYRLGDRITDLIQEVLDKRGLIGDNADGFTITNKIGWKAWGYYWTISVAQDRDDPRK